MGAVVGSIINETVGNIVKVVGGAALLFVPGFQGAGLALIASGASSLISGNKGALGEGEESDYQDPGQRLRLTANTNLVREIAYGTVRSAGNLIFRDTTGTNNEYLHTVTLLAGHEIESIETVDWGGESVTFTSNSAKNGKWKQYEKLGGPSQVAETNLVSASDKWTSTHIGSGLAYVVNRYEYDPETEFKNGLQTVTYTFKGRKVYDPRLDTTNTAASGSGSHRVNNETTYEWSNNPALCLLDYMIGHSENGERIFGKFVNTDWIDWASWVAAINICDESVSLDAGGTEARYTCDGFINPTNTHKANIERLLTCFAGEMMFQGGKWYLYAGAARTAVKTRNADHFIGTVNYEAKKDLSDKKNGVRGEFYDASNGYQLQPYPTYQNATYLAADGGQEQYLDISFPMTSSVTMAQRLAKIALGRARMERKVSVTTNLIGLQDRAGDVVTVDYPRLNLVSQEMKIISWAMKVQKGKDGNKGLVIAQQYLEEDSTIYDWASSEEGTIAPPGTLNRNDKELLDYQYIGGTTKPDDNATHTDNEAVVIGANNNLFANGQFKLLADDGRPAGVRASNDNTDASSIISLPNTLRLASLTDLILGMTLVAFKVNIKSTYRISFKVKNSTYDDDIEGTLASGFYSRMFEYDSDLAAGERFVGGGLYESSGDIVTADRAKDGLIDVGTTAAYVEKSFTYTPTSTAKWASLHFTKVVAFGDRALDIQDVVIAEIAPQGDLVDFDQVDTTEIIDNAVTEVKSSFDSSVVCGTDKLFDDLGSVSFTDVSDFSAVVLQYTGAMFVASGNQEKCEIQFTKGGVQLTNAEVNTGCEGLTNVGTPCAALSFTDTSPGTGSKTYKAIGRVSSASPSVSLTFSANHLTAIGVKK